MKIGLQLYNFRKELKADFKGTLREIAKLGIDGVEFAGDYGNMQPQELADFLAEIKLECAGTMFPAATLQEKENICYEYARVLKSPALTFSMMCNFTELHAEKSQMIKTAVRNANANGCDFSYHNHWDEFLCKIDGEYAMEYMIREIDEPTLLLEPDVCWVTRGGHSPIQFLQDHASAIKQVHLKDIKVPSEYNSLTELGNGVIDLKGSIAAAKKTACQWLIYEQDLTELTPMESASISLKWLKDNL